MTDNTSIPESTTPSNDHYSDTATERLAAILESDRGRPVDRNTGTCVCGRCTSKFRLAPQRCGIKLHPEFFTVFVERDRQGQATISIYKASDIQGEPLYVFPVATT